MKHLEKYDPSSDPELKDWYEKWKDKVKEETEKAIETYKKNGEYTFKTSLYGEYKKVLYKMSDDKCFYCESTISDTHPGDVEHYRPKSEVSEDDKHPGYYWLAYDESNFLLSCEKCNRGGSKATHFPIEGTRAYKPEDDLSKEKPLLINPLEVKPDEHLDFCPKNFDQGKSEIAPKTLNGKVTVETLNLNREKLAENRSQQQVNILNNLNSLLTISLNLKEYHKLGVIFTQEIAMAVKKEYSAACVSVILRKRNEIIEGFKAIIDI